jgi:GTPase involved in cell partitioning and DNA repair
MRNAYVVLAGKPAGGDLGIGGRVILKWTLQI